MSSKVEQQIVLAEYYMTGEELWLFIVNPFWDEPKVFSLSAVDHTELQKLVWTYFGQGSHVRDLFSTGSEDIWHRYDSLIAPLASVTNPGDMIYFVPYGLLHYLPLHALKLEGSYLIERNPVLYSPSASVLKYCQLKRKKNVDGTPSRRTAAIFGDSRNDLLYARTEANMLAQLFNSRAILGDAVTHASFQEQVRGVDIVHFAGHASFQALQPLESGLQLSGNVILTARDIFRIKELHTYLVTLSGCDTGVNETRPGDELLGLTRALIYAGTPSVVVSLWSVDDFSASLLMTHFYQQLLTQPECGSAQLINKAEALKAAQLYIKNLTAQQVVDYCHQQLEDLSQSHTGDSMLGFLLGLAYAQVIAGDLQQAFLNYQHLQNITSTLGTERAKKLDSQLSQTLQLLEIKSRRPSAINYNKQLFNNFYHWAPFVLIGDWQ